jgi:excinuclease ABC subunit A
VIAQGTPEQVADTAGSHTGEFLRPVLRGHRVPVAEVPEPLIETPPPQRRRRAS